MIVILSIILVALISAIGAGAIIYNAVYSEPAPIIRPKQEPELIPKTTQTTIPPPNYQQSTQDQQARIAVENERLARERAAQQEAERQRLYQAQQEAERQRIAQQEAEAEAERIRLAQEEQAKQLEEAQAQALRDYYSQIDGSFVTSGDDYGRVLDGKMNPIKDFATLQSCHSKFGGSVIENQPDIFKTIEKSNELTFEDCPNIYEGKFVTNGSEYALIRNNQKIVFDPTGMMSYMCFQKYGEPITVDSRALNSYSVSSDVITFDDCPNTLESKMITIDGSQIGFIKDNKRITLDPSGLFSFYCSQAWGDPVQVSSSVFNGFEESPLEISYSECPNVYEDKLVQSESGAYGYVIKGEDGKYTKRLVPNTLLEKCIATGNYSQFNSPMFITQHLFDLLENGPDMTFEECGSQYINKLIQNSDTGELAMLIEQDGTFIKRKLSSNIRLICKETGTYSQFDIAIPIENSIYSNIPYGDDITMNECALTFKDVLVKNKITGQLAYVVQEIRTTGDPPIEGIVYIKRIVESDEFRRMCIDSGNFSSFENIVDISAELYDTFETGDPIIVNECLAYNNVILINRADPTQKSLIKYHKKHPIEEGSLLDDMCKTKYINNGLVKEVSNFIYNGFEVSTEPVTFADCPNLLNGKLIKSTPNNRWYYIFNDKYRYIPDPGLIDLCIDSGNFTQFKQFIEHSEDQILKMENGGNLVSSECPNPYINKYVTSPTGQKAYITLDNNSKVIMREFSDPKLATLSCYSNTNLWSNITARLYDYLQKNKGPDMSAKDCTSHFAEKLWRTDNPDITKQWYYVLDNSQFNTPDSVVHIVDGNYPGALELHMLNAVDPIQASIRMSGITQNRIDTLTGGFGIIPHSWIMSLPSVGSKQVPIPYKFSNAFIKDNLGRYGYNKGIPTYDFQQVTFNDFNNYCPKYHKNRWTQDNSLLPINKQKYEIVSKNIFDYFMKYNTGNDIISADCLPTRKIMNVHYGGIEMAHHVGIYGNAVMMRGVNEAPTDRRDWVYDKNTKQIKSTATGQCLDRHVGNVNLYGPGTANDQYAVMNQCGAASHAAQRWTITPNTNAQTEWIIKNDLNGEIMDTYGHSGNDRANVMRPYAPAFPHRRWKLI